MKTLSAPHLVVFLSLVLGPAMSPAADDAAPPFYPDKMKLLVWRDAQGA